MHVVSKHMALFAINVDAFIVKIKCNKKVSKFKMH